MLHVEGQWELGRGMIEARCFLEQASECGANAKALAPIPTGWVEDSEESEDVRGRGEGDVTTERAAVS